MKPRRTPIVRAEVERAVNKANELASRAESIRKFEIVPDEFTEENGLGHAEHEGPQAGSG